MAVSTARRRRPDPSPSRPAPADRTVADLLRQLGNVPARRVLLHPAPGTATEADVLRLVERDKRLCELVDGVLVEKAAGFWEAVIGAMIGSMLLNHSSEKKLGIVLVGTGAIRLLGRQVRIPSVSFYSWERSPCRRGKRRIPDVAPELAVEVLRRSNTRAEIDRKLAELFHDGTILAWVVEPRTRSVRVYTAPKTFTTLGPDDNLDGGAALPGFDARVSDLFSPERPEPTA